MKTATEVLDAFENIHRAQRAGVYAPHKPLLIRLALARVQRGEPRMVEFTAFDKLLKQLLAEFGPSGAAKSRHYPFWHLATDCHGALWDLSGPREVLKRSAGAIPSLGELRANRIKAGFPADVDEALRHIPGLLQAVESRVLDTYFPATLHADIVATLGLDLDGASELRDSAPAPADYTTAERRRRDPGFRERVLRAYEYRCCVCGLDLRIGHTPAGLEASRRWSRHRAQRPVAVRAARQAIQPGRVHCRAGGATRGLQPARDQRWPRHGRRAPVPRAGNPCAAAGRSATSA